LEIEVAHHFGQLVKRHVGGDAEGTDRPELAEQVAIAGEQHATVGRRARDERVVAGVHRKLERVRADGAEPARESAEHGVGEKAGVLHHGSSRSSAIVLVAEPALQLDAEKGGTPFGSEDPWT
jgi:hypothetical protein